MGRYIFKVPVEGIAYYDVEADSYEEAHIKLNRDLEVPDKPIESELMFMNDFELDTVLEPGINDED